MRSEHEYVWHQFGAIERCGLSMLLLVFGSVQLAILDTIAAKHAAGTAPNLTGTFGPALLVAVFFVGFGGPLIRAGAARIGPRLRERFVG